MYQASAQPWQRFCSAMASTYSLASIVQPVDLQAPASAAVGTFQSRCLQTLPAALMCACTCSLQVFDAYGEEGLKGGAPPPGAAADAAGGMPSGMPGGMPGGSTYFHFGGPGGASYSGMDSARAANLFASLFGQNPEAFGGAFGAGGGPRSRVNMFSRKGSARRSGLDELFGDGHFFHDGGTGARPAGSGTTGYAWGGAGGRRNMRRGHAPFSAQSAATSTMVLLSLLLQSPLHLSSAQQPNWAGNLQAARLCRPPRAVGACAVTSCLNECLIE
jgi:hypothetical protein